MFFEESGCKLEGYPDYEYIKLDNTDLYKVLSDWLKAVDFIVVTASHDVYLIEFKRYDAFGKDIDTKIKEILEKFSDSYFILNNSDILGNKHSQKIEFILIVSPPYDTKYQKVFPDRKIAIIEDIKLRLHRKLKGLTLRWYVVTGDENNNVTSLVFKNISF